MSTMTVSTVVLVHIPVSLVVLIHILALVVVSVTAAPTVVLTIIFLRIFIPDIIIAIISILVPYSWHPLFRMVYHMPELQKGVIHHVREPELPIF